MKTGYLLLQLPIVLLTLLLPVFLPSVGASTHQKYSYDTSKIAIDYPGNIRYPKQRYFFVSIDVPTDRTVRWSLVLRYRLYISWCIGAEAVRASIYLSNGFSHSLEVYLPITGGSEDTGIVTRSWTGVSRGVSSLGFYGYVYAEASGWSGSAYALAEMIKITLKAEWPDKVTVTASSGGSVSPSGVLEVWGSYLSVKATPSPGYVFDRWEVSGKIVVLDNSANGRFRVSGDGTIRAVFRKAEEKKYKLTISISPPGSGTTNPTPGVHYYAEGTRVTVRALPSWGYYFDYWLLDGRRAGSSSTITVLMNRDHGLVAVFRRKTLYYRLTIRVSPEGSGYTTPSVGTHYYPSGTWVRVKAYSRPGYQFSYWLLDGRVAGWRSEIYVAMYSHHTLTAVFKKKQSTTTYIKVDSLKVEVWPVMYNTSEVYGSANRLLRGEWFMARVTVEASAYTASGPGGVKPATVQLAIPDREWFSFSTYSGGKLALSNRTYTCSLTVNSEGTHTFWIPFKVGESWKADRDRVGVFTFSVQYSWSNGHSNGKGIASAQVLVADKANGVYTVLYWLPVSVDEAYILVVPYWPDGKPIRYRPWFSSKTFMAASIKCEKWECFLDAGKWYTVEGNFTKYYDAKIWGNLSRLEDSTGVFYRKVLVYEVEVKGLSATALLSFSEWLPEKQVHITELALPVYALNWSNNRVQGRLKVIDWANVKPVQEGWTVILVENLNTGKIAEYWFYANPYTNFTVSTPEKYEVWAIALAPGVDTIYLNLKHGRILLLKVKGMP